MSAAKKLGGPRKGEEREELKTISFRVDTATGKALEALVAKEGAGSMRARSTVLRRLILESFERLSRPV